MPIYEYECNKCGHHAEVWQKISDPEVTTCECCKGEMKKLISQSSFHLKGTGWYVTDYKSKRESEKKSHKPETKTSEEKPKNEASSAASKPAEA